MHMSILYFKGSQVETAKLNSKLYFCPRRWFFVEADSADLHYAAFHLGLLCLPKFEGISNDKVLSL